MKFKVEKQVLKNGLTVVRVPMETESVTVLLLVRVGSRDESQERNGISHFLEHMVFKGTKKWRTAMEMNRVIDSIGGVYNAFTSRETTGFWVKVAKQHLSLGLEFVYQAVFEPLLPADELERERGVVLEEIKMYEDNPMSKVARSFMEQIYKKTALGRAVIGPAENIKKMEQDDFFGHLNQWYQPGNMVLGVVGGVKETGLEVVKEVFGKLNQGKARYRDKPVKIEIEQDQPLVQVRYKDIQQAHFCLGVRSFKRRDKDRYGLAMLNTILGGNTSSRLWEEIREKRGLVYYVKSGSSGFYETGHVVTQAGCDVKRVEEAIEVTRGEYDKIAKVKAEELKMAKEFLKGRLALELEDSQEVAGLLTEDLLLEGKMRSVEEIVKGVEAVTVKDVERVANRVFDRQGLNLTVVGPFKNRERFAKLV